MKTQLKVAGTATGTLILGVIIVGAITMFMPPERMPLGEKRIGDWTWTAKEDSFTGLREGHAVNTTKTLYLIPSPPEQGRSQSYFAIIQTEFIPTHCTSDCFVQVVFPNEEPIEMDLFSGVPDRLLAVLSSATSPEKQQREVRRFYKLLLRHDSFKYRLQSDHKITGIVETKGIKQVGKMFDLSP